MKTTPLLILAALAILSVHSSAQPTVDFLITNRIAEPYGIAVDNANKFYITDSADHRILRYDPDNGSLTNLAGIQGSRGNTNGPGFIARFFSPKGIIAARNGLLIADSGNHALRFLSLTGRVAVVSDFAGVSQQPGFLDGPIATARFNNPSGLAQDHVGNIYVADAKNNAIRKIDLNNTVSTVATNFSEPSAIAVGSNNELFVADTRNHAIKIIHPNGSVELLAGRGLPTGSGTNDSFFAEDALFNSPAGMLWLGDNTGLIISDSGNHTLRRVYFDPLVASFFPERNGYSVETYAGIPGQRGFSDGLLGTARFNSPIGLARDFDNGLLVADLGNKALRRIQTTPRLPRVTEPKIGLVTFVIDETTGAEVSKLQPFSEAVFYNDVILAILAEEGTETFYTSGQTPGLFEPDSVPIPNSNNSQPAPVYSDGVLRSQVRPSFLDPKPDITVKAISSADGRRPSELVRARVQFKVATPVIQGDNPASFTLKTETTDADIWYTLDGSTPTNQFPSIQASAESLSLRITNALTFRARGFRANFKPSEITTKTFFPTDFQANRISFGFERGEASSRFVGSAGQTFYAPVTLSLLQGQSMYTLQFNVTVTNQNNAVPVAPGAVGFQSLLLEPTPKYYRTIEPKMFDRYIDQVFTNIVPNGILITTNREPYFRDLVSTNPSLNLLAVGWLEVIGETNLYNTLGQDLISYSRAHERIFRKSEGKVVVGGYSFQVPLAASSNSEYRIQIGRPSAIDNALSRDVFIDAPTNGSFSAGPISAIKDIRIVPGGLNEGELHYIVGDLLPFRWFNAGDFGDTNILSQDVLQIFQASAYGLNVPPSGSDFFDAMDSCCGTDSDPSLANVFDGGETFINDIKFGDGELDVTDVFVTFRRSLDPSLKWYARFWVSGQRQAAEIPNQFRGRLNAVQNDEPAAAPSLTAKKTLTAKHVNPSISFSVDDFKIRPGETISVPIHAEVFGDYPARVLMLNLSVEAIDNSPRLVVPVEFIPSSALGAPVFAHSNSRENYSAAWLNSRVEGLIGKTEVGRLRISIPSSATLSSSYRIHFEHASASPNGLTRLPRRTQDGLLTNLNHDGSSFGDIIPDHWRLRHFGSVSNFLSQAEADADGDGMSNLAEFKAGTHPNDLKSSLKVLLNNSTAAGASQPKFLRLRWPSIKDKKYVIEASPAISSSQWIQLAEELMGNGGEMEFRINSEDNALKFFRVRIVE